MIRLAPYIAMRSDLSRRQAEKAILEGRISLDGQIVSTFCVDSVEGLVLDGCALERPKEARMWAYHKPVGELVTRYDPQGRATVFESVRTSVPEGPLVAIGRLDYESEGLLLFTNTPIIAHQLETSRWERTYQVWVRGRLCRKSLINLAKGACIDEIFYRPFTFVIGEQEGTRTCLTLKLQEGKKREIRLLMRAIKLQVLRLTRISFGPFELGTLGKGQLSEYASSTLRVALARGNIQIAPSS